MKIPIATLLLFLLTSLVADAQNLITNKPQWSLNFLIVDETGTPLSGAKIIIAYLDTSKPGAVTISNWFAHMTLTNVVSDRNGLCTILGVGTPDAWQCHFLKQGYQNIFQMYRGPSDYTAVLGAGSAHQKHTVMLAKLDAPFSTYPKWTVAIKAVDLAGRPVQEASAEIYYHNNQSIKGLTDSNGMFAMSTNLFVEDICLTVQKTGYYDARKIIELGQRENYDPLRWNQTVSLLLYKKDPVPMYARRAQIQIPLVDKPVGFDLIKNDWVAPCGNGEQSDIIFETHRRWVSRRDFDSILQVTFSKRGDGLIIAPASSMQGSSGPTIPVTAPLNGYIPKLQCELSNTPAEGWKDDTKGQNYYFRVRTVLDENNNAKTAFYGKVYGGFTLDPINSKTTLIIFTYYLNPAPNSRCTEFDPKQNLFKNLKFMEGVSAP